MHHTVPRCLTLSILLYNKTLFFRLFLHLNSVVDIKLSFLSSNFINRLHPQRASPTQQGGQCGKWLTWWKDNWYILNLSLLMGNKCINRGVITFCFNIMCSLRHFDPPLSNAQSSLDGVSLVSICLNCLFVARILETWE